MPNRFIKVAKKAVTAAVTFTTITWSVGVAGMPLVAKAAVPTAPALIKASTASVYYLATDGKRYVFPNEATFFTWYTDFSAVQTITDAELASIAIGGNVTMREGSWAAKITTDPKTYWVGRGGSLHHIQSEADAVKLMGSDWAQQVRDVPDAFFVNYKVGAPLDSSTLTADGMLFRTVAGGQIYLVDGGKARKVTADGMSANRFQDKFVRTRADLSVAAAALLSLGTDVTTNEILAKSNPATASGAPIPPPTVAGDLTISLNAGNPGARNIIASAGVGGELAEIMRMDFKAGGSKVKVSKLVFTRSGISTDSDLDNVYLKYDDKTIEMNSLSSNKATFDNSAGLFEVDPNSTKVVSLWADVNRAATAGKTMRFTLSAAGDVSAAAVLGTFPLEGALMTVAQVTDLARAVITGQATGTSVDPGTNQFEDFRFTVQAQNQKIQVTKFLFTFVGTADVTDFANFKLFDGATELGSIASMSSNKILDFTLTTPLVIDSGQTRTIALRKDVIGGSGRTDQFQIQRRFHIAVRDMNYNVAIEPDTAVGTFATVNSTLANITAGNLIISLDPGSPSGNSALNGIDQVLAKYKIRAVGEALRFSSLIVQLTSDAFAGATNWTNLRNVRILYAAPGGTLSQVGTTQATIAEDVATTITLNFTVPATATDGTLEVRSDIAAAAGAANAVANGETVQARLNTGAANVQRNVSGGTLNGPAANTNGNILTATAATLAVAANPAFGNQTLSTGSVSTRLGSYLLTTGSEAVDVTSLQVRDDAAGGGLNNGANALGAAFNNLTLRMGGGTSGIAQVISTNTADAVGTLYTFNLSPVLRIAGNSTQQVDLWGDIINAAVWTATDATRVTTASGTSVVTSTAVVSGGAEAQQITLVAGATLTVSVDSGTPVRQQIAMGTNAPVIAKWKFSANTVGPIDVSQLIITNLGNNAVVNTLKLEVDGVQVGSTIPAFSGASTATFSATPKLFQVPSGGNKVVSLTGVFTTRAAGGVSGANVQARLPVPAATTGALADTIIARDANSGGFALFPAAANFDGQAQVSQVDVFHAVLTQVGTRARQNGELVARLRLTGKNGDGAEFRGALRANTEQVGDLNPGAGNDWTATGMAVAANATAPVIEGANTIRWTEDGASATADLIQYDFGTGLVGLNRAARASGAFRCSAAKAAAGDILISLSDTADVIDGALNLTGGVTANMPALATANEWAIFDVALAAGATSRFLIFSVGAGGADNGATCDFENVRLYRDGISFNVSGNFSAAQGGINVASATRFLLRQGGQNVAVGNYSGTGGAAGSGTVGFTASDFLGNVAASVGNPISIPAGNLDLDVLVDTATGTATTLGLMAADTTATEVLNISLTFGTASSFMWNDFFGNANTTMAINELRANVNGVLQPEPQTMAGSY